MARPAAPERALVVSTHPLLRLRRTFLGGHLSEEGGGWLPAPSPQRIKTEGGWPARSRRPGNLIIREGRHEFSPHLRAPVQSAVPPPSETYDDDQFNLDMAVAISIMFNEVPHAPKKAV